MRFILHGEGQDAVAELAEEGLVIACAGDFLDAMGEAGTMALVMGERHFHPDFFRLGTGLAGEILQKCSNYGLRLGIAGDFSKYRSEALRAFINESNRTGQVLFLPSVEACLARLGI